MKKVEGIWPKSKDVGNSRNDKNNKNIGTIAKWEHKVNCWNPNVKKY